MLTIQNQFEIRILSTHELNKIQDHLVEIKEPCWAAQFAFNYLSSLYSVIGGGYYHFAEEDKYFFCGIASSCEQAYENEDGDNVVWYIMEIPEFVLSKQTEKELQSNQH